MQKTLAIFFIAFVFVAAVLVFLGCQTVTTETTKNCVKSPDGTREVCKICKVKRLQPDRPMLCWLEEEGKKGHEYLGGICDDDIVFSPDSKRFAYVGGWGPWFAVYLDLDKIAFDTETEGCPHSLMFSKDGKHLAYFTIQSGTDKMFETITIDRNHAPQDVCPMSVLREMHQCSDGHFLTVIYGGPRRNGEKITQVFLDRHLVFDDIGEVKSFVCNKDTVELNLATPLASGLVVVDLNNPVRIYPCLDNHFLMIDSQYFDWGRPPELRRMQVLLDDKLIFEGDIDEIKDFSCNRDGVRMKIDERRAIELKYDLKGNKIE